MRNYNCDTNTTSNYLETGRWYCLTYKVDSSITVTRTVYITDVDEKNWYFYINKNLTRVRIPKINILKVVD